MNSVLNQSHSDIEYVIVDGVSKDGTMALIESKAKAHSNIVYVSEPDKGIYDALNKGIQMATGDVIGFVHSDDVLANPSVLEDIASKFKTQGCDGVYGNLHYVAHDDIDKVIRNWVSQDFTPQLLSRGWMPAHPTLFLKAAVYNTYGNFDISYKIAADYEFILRIFKQDSLSFVYLPKTIVKMRVGGASNRSLKNIIQKTKEDYKAIRLHKLGGFGSIALKNLSKLKQFVKTS
jgi:glycosyltransferase